MSDGGIDYYADAGTVDASSIADVAAVAARKALTQDGDFLVLALVTSSAVARESRGDAAARSREGFAATPRRVVRRSNVGRGSGGATWGRGCGGAGR